MTRKRRSHTNREVRSLCSKLTERISALISDTEQFNRYIIKEGKDTPTSESTFAKADTKAVKEMAQALKALSECSAILDGDTAACDTPQAAKITVKFEDSAEELSE